MGLVENTGREAESLEGILERIVYTGPEDAWSVVKVKVPGRPVPVTVVGNLLGVRPGEHLRFTGRWVQNPKYGEQFEVSSYETLLPTTLEAMEKYLASGLIRGIGPVMARRIVARFGEETLSVLEEHPQRLVEVEGIGPKRLRMIRRSWAEQREIQELMLFLQSLGVGIGQAVRIYKTYGRNAVETIRQDPYRLAREIYGIGFKSADGIARRLGFEATSPRRVAAGVLYVLEQGGEQGHLFLPKDRLVEEAERVLEVERASVEAAIESLADAGLVIREALPGDEGEALYPAPLHAAEVETTQRLLALLAAPAPPLKIHVERALRWLEERQGLKLGEEQRQAIRQVFSSKVLVITGGPGTGKTTLVRGIVEILRRKEQEVLLTAPTGRAAKRLAEATGQEARTLHRLLEFSPQRMAFDRSPDRPLTVDFLIVDEVSMVDVPLARHLLAALPDSARLILVGDVDQLPSVGPGRFLADLIASGRVEVARLTQIFRQGPESRIVVNAHRVNRGEMPLVAPSEEGLDFYFIERSRPEEILETLCQLVTQRIPRSFHLDPLQEIQVLTPMNKGLLGVANLNAVLQGLLNPHGRPATGGGRSLRIGDKVMQVRNNYELEVFNGDIGRIVAADHEEQEVRIDFDDRVIRYDQAALDEVVLAYACSIHKAQGSEYPAVVAPLHQQHYPMLERNLLYTALSRGKRLVVLVGERRALELAVRRKRSHRRYSLLAARLTGEVPQPVMAAPR